MEGRKIYFISGLGADERVFHFLDLPGYERIYVQWPKPTPNDTIKSYAQKIISTYEISEGATLVGVSFGGLVCQEIAGMIKCNKVIIISSIKNYKEMAWQLRFVRFSHIHKLVPTWFLKWSNHLTADYYFGVSTESEKKLLHKIIDDTDRYFMKWAINAIMQWPRESEISGIYHIHGTNDKIFPVNNMANYNKIEGGGHFMIVNRASEVSSLIIEHLEN